MRPQHGITILKEELDALTFKNGIAVAKDDVSGNDLVPALVRTARDEEIAYFIKGGFIRLCPGVISVPPEVKSSEQDGWTLTKAMQRYPIAGLVLSVGNSILGKTTIFMRRRPH